MTTETRKAPSAQGPPVDAANRSTQTRPKRRLWLAWTLVAVLVVAAALSTVALRRGGGTDGNATQGLPNSPDYHSLSVSPLDPNEILLGTHDGLYRSGDGGKSWQSGGLSGRDAMNVVRPREHTLWTAGHNVLAKSSDGGARWVDVRPSGLPSLDVHGFAVDPRDPRTLYAAIAGRGLYRSTDDGVSFSLVSSEVGGAVMALAIMRSGVILAGDMRRGLLSSSDGGKAWRLLLRAQVMGLAVNPQDPKRILAAGPGILVSADAGKRWRQPLELEEGAGPVAWSPTDPELAYVVGFDRVLYRSSDRGETWMAV